MPDPLATLVPTALDTGPGPRVSLAPAAPVAGATGADARGDSVTISLGGAPRDLLASLAQTAPPPKPLSDGWRDDAGRGVGTNLGDTEAALHLFYARHPELGGRPPAPGTDAAKELDGLRLTQFAADAATRTDGAESHWTSFGSRSVKVGADDRATALAILGQQHPELGGKPPAKGTPLADDLKRLEVDVAQNKYNATIDAALAAHPTAGIDAKTFKSLLVQESGLDPNVGTNHAGYTGIAQLGSDLATKAQANDPSTAIPIAAEALHGKAAYLEKHVFPDFQLDATDKTKFILGAYNGGEGTMQKAMSTYRAEHPAKPAGKPVPKPAPTPITWDDILSPHDDITKSPVYQAVPPAWGQTAKYHEIGDYANDIVSRATQP